MLIISILALSVFAPQIHLSQRERPWQRDEVCMDCQRLSLWESWQGRQALTERASPLNIQNIFNMIEKGCCTGQRAAALAVFCIKIRPGHRRVNGALKTDAVFFTGARSLQSRSYAAGGARYLHADLMLLTHAGCALKGPRGRFGISSPCAKGGE